MLCVDPQDGMLVWLFSPQILHQCSGCTPRCSATCLLPGCSLQHFCRAFLSCRGKEGTKVLLHHVYLCLGVFHPRAVAEDEPGEAGEM